MAETKSEGRVYRVEMYGAELGPYTPAQIREMWRTGALDGSALYWRESSETWEPLTLLMNQQRPSSKPELPRAAEVQPASETTAHQNAPAGPRLSTTGAQLVKAQRSRGIYIILALVTGGLGFHNFYAGHLSRGVGELAACATAVLLAFTVSPIAGGVLAGLVFLFVLWEIGMETRDGDGDPMI